MWLHEESPGNRAFFPDPQNQRFLLNDDVGILITNLVAMGSPVQTTSSAASVLRMPSASSEPPTSGLHSQTQFTAARKAQSTNVKIMQASIKRLNNGKLEFLPQNQTFVDVTETTANVHYVSSVIQRKWGPEYVLVTSDGLKLDDSSGTQGMFSNQTLYVLNTESSVIHQYNKLLHFIGLKFWKVGSRKLYAVRNSDLKEKKRVASVINLSSSSSDEEMFAPLAKRKSTAEYVKLSILSTDVREVKSSLAKIFTVTNSMSVPVGLRVTLYDTFKCSICQSTPMVPPIIFAKCCKSILGCQSCVDTWYRGDEGQSRTCPKCRSDRAYVETCKLNGLDDFLTIIAPLMETGPDDSDDVVD